MDVGIYTYINTHTCVYMFLYMCVYIFIYNTRLFGSCIHIQFFKVLFNCNVTLVYILKNHTGFPYILSLALIQEIQFLYATIGITKIQVRDYSKTIPKAAVSGSNTQESYYPDWVPEPEASWEHIRNAGSQAPSQTC